MFETLKIISLRVNRISFNESLEKVMEWGLHHIPSFVCFANVHMTIEAKKDSTFLEKLNKASLILTDGKPLAFACKLLYNKKQDRIAGMDFVPRILELANKKKATIFLYGSTDEVLNQLQEKIRSLYPKVIIGGAISPPFTPSFSSAVIDDHIRVINESKANLVFVTLGCPKQEKWMADNYTKINAVLLGVGGALPVMAGLQKRAPVWMQKWSLEWLYRLLQEPKRMFKRYMYTNSMFIILLLKAILKNNPDDAIS